MLNIRCYIKLRSGIYGCLNKKTLYLIWLAFQLAIQVNFHSIYCQRGMEFFWNKFENSFSQCTQSWLQKERKRSADCIYGEILVSKRGKGATRRREVPGRKKRSANIYKWLRPKTLQWTLSLTLIKCASFLLFSFFSISLPTRGVSSRVSAQILRVLPLQPSPSRDEEQNRVAVRVRVGRALRAVTMPQGWESQRGSFFALRKDSGREVWFQFCVLCDMFLTRRSWLWEIWMLEEWVVMSVNNCVNYIIKGSFVNK